MASKPGSARREPKPCPRCYAPMRPTPKGFACKRHGIPEPQRPVVVTRAPEGRERARKPRSTKPSSSTKPRVRSGRNPTRDPAKVRYPSDLKQYPLPPSLDGRAHGRTGRQSPTTARSRLTPDLVREASERARQGETPWQIAGDMWERAGYAGRHACKGSLYRALRNAWVLA